MYGYPRLSSVDLVRAAMIKKMVGDGSAIPHSSKIDLSRLPPCRLSLLHTSRESIIGLHNGSIMMLTSLIYQHQQNMDGRLIKESWSLFGLRGLFCRWDLQIFWISMTPQMKSMQESLMCMSRNLKVHSLLMNMIKSGHWVEEYHLC